ncbi:MAG: hypothetical protein GY838_03885 [bacterium]|nr:hypothetical protein [bacterium]
MTTTSPQRGWSETAKPGVFACDACGLTVPMQPDEWPIHHKCSPPCPARGEQLRTVRHKSRCGTVRQVAVYDCDQWGECTKVETCGTLLPSCDVCEGKQ